MEITNTCPWGRDLSHSTSDRAQKESWGYWELRINRASLVMLSEQKILAPDVVRTIARAQKKAEEKFSRPGAEPLTDIMPLEKALIDECGQEATLIHTGRSRQDIFATLNQARLRRSVLDLGEALCAFRSTLLKIAEQHAETLMPAYTNGVQAMPITLGFYLWSFLEALGREFDTLREGYARVNRSALGSAVLANSAWPLSRERLAELLGFDGPIVNSLDSSQVSLFDVPLEAAGVAGRIAVLISTMLADIAQQYAQTRPWLLLDQGSTYSSSAMPQKRNPGIINKARAKAGDVIGAVNTCFIRAHNLPLGMYDNKESVSEDNTAVFVKAVHLLALTKKTFELLRVSKERAEEELENDWTCTMALAEGLQREFDLPFRVGHNFASAVVTAARREGWIPKTFPYDEAKQCYRAVTEKLLGKAGELPMSEAEFRRYLSPGFVVRTRVGTGSPAPDSTRKGLAAVRTALERDAAWVAGRNAALDEADRRLDAAFEALLK